MYTIRFLKKSHTQNSPYAEATHLNSPGCLTLSHSPTSRRLIHGLFAFLSYDKIIDVSFCYAANAA